MQPYFLPYIGYFQLINLCDKFVIYDDIQFTKRGWINRNRILARGQPLTVTIPVAKDSDFLDICRREVAGDFKSGKMMNIFRESYRGAPFWTEQEQMLGEILGSSDRNLFGFVANSLRELVGRLEIDTELVVSSTLDVDRRLVGQERVVATCQAIGATDYVNPIGGRELYTRSYFAESGIELSFLKSKLTPYDQGGAPWVEALSIIDGMMFVEPEELRSRVVNDYVVCSRTSAAE